MYKKVLKNVLKNVQIENFDKIYHGCTCKSKFFHSKEKSRVGKAWKTPEELAQIEVGIPTFFCAAINCIKKMKLII